MRVVVTGGSGYLGAWLVRSLVSRGDTVVNFDLLPFPDSTLRIQDVRGDIRDREALERACAGAEVIVHSAALVPLTKAGRRFYEVNVGGTRAVLDVARRLRLRKVIHISSSAVFGVPSEVPITAQTPRTPVEDYGRSKAQAEELCEAERAHGLNVVILRPRTIVGPGRLGIFHILFEWIAHNQRVYLIGRGDNRMQLVSRADVCAACVLAIDRADRVTLGIGGRAFGSLRDDLSALITHARSHSRIVSLPQRSTVAALRLLDALHLSPFSPYHYLALSATIFYDDAAAAVLGYRPRDGNVEILTQAYDWYLQQRAGTDQQATSIHQRPPRQRLVRLLRWLP